MATILLYKSLHMNTKSEVLCMILKYKLISDTHARVHMLVKLLMLTFPRWEPYSTSNKIHGNTSQALKAKKCMQYDKV